MTRNDVVGEAHMHYYQSEDPSSSSVANVNNYKYESIRVAQIGNSIQYYNDCPRLLEHILRQTHVTVEQNSCLRGGASLVSIWKKGNGMKTKFASPNAVIKPSWRDDDSASTDTIKYDIGASTVQALLGQDEGKLSKGQQSDRIQKEKKRWDFVILNDHTQSPARDTTRNAAIEVLRERYAPMFMNETKNVIFIQTAAYRQEGIKDSEDLGSFDRFTSLLQGGYEKYVEILSSFNVSAKIAPVGLAYKYVKEHEEELQLSIKKFNIDNQNQQDEGNKKSHLEEKKQQENNDSTKPTTTTASSQTSSLWAKLYARDSFHPSPHGTWLQACVLYCTMVGEAPPEQYDVSWWETARYMQPPPSSADELSLPVPTIDEAMILRQVACHVCQIAPVADDTSSLTSSSSANMKKEDGTGTSSRL